MQEAPGWWRASDGRWYAPEQAPEGWWLASDGRLYPPHLHPDHPLAEVAQDEAVEPDTERATPPRSQTAPMMPSMVDGGQTSGDWEVAEYVSALRAAATALESELARTASEFRTLERLFRAGEDGSSGEDGEEDIAPTPDPGVSQQLVAPPAGWCVDMSGSGALRWWDGAKWTDHVATRAALPEA
jgi:hypothetical protein